MEPFDLLTTVDQGGCSAKLPAAALARALAGLPVTSDPNLLVGIDTHDDAGVYRISEDLALILTTDFFTPVCSDPYEFGQIAAANALSDVYAMGGEVMTALNIAAFPATVPLEVLREILHGGTDKVIEAGGTIAGGHTIVNDTPVFGLSVTGKVHPGRIVTNAGARPGEVLILTKPVGSGIILAGHKVGLAAEEHLRIVLDSMKQLNAGGAVVMQRFGTRCATDVTGFGLAGHALKLAKASGTTVRLFPAQVPVFPGVTDLLDLGCIPGACFRNLEYAEEEARFAEGISYERKMLMMDAQTSGGLLICCDPARAYDMLCALAGAGYPSSAVVGEVTEFDGKYLELSA